MKMKRIIPKKHMRTLKRNAKKLQKSARRFRKSGLSTVMVAALLLAATGYKKPAQADAGRGALFGGITGAALGGAFGGGKYAGIGAAAGVGLGALAGSARSSHRRGRDPYRRLNREQERLARLENRAERYREKVANASSERRRERAQRDLDRIENRIANKRDEIADIKRILGVR